MNLREIRESIWRKARELNVPDVDRLWPAAEMNQYINRTERRLARECRLIRDARTAEIVLLSFDLVDYTTLTADDGLDYIWATTPTSWLYQQDVCPYVVDLDSRIIDIDEAKLIEYDWKLRKVSCQKWQQNIRWEQTKGMPTEYATDLQNNSFAVNFRSEQAFRVQLVVKRLPLADMVKDEDTPEIRVDYHDRFQNDVLAQMFEKHDAQAFDEKARDRYEQKARKDIDDIKFEESRLHEMLRPNHPTEAHRP